MKRIGVRVYQCYLLVTLLCGTLPLALCQQRSSALSWQDQTLLVDDFRVHSFEVFSGANLLQVVLSAPQQRRGRAISCWLRHDSIPTQSSFRVRADLHLGKEKEVSLHVDNPLIGRWFLLVSARKQSNEEKMDASDLESHEHLFVSPTETVSYTVTFTSHGCVRGRQLWPHCDSDWMRLTWGKVRAM